MKTERKTKKLEDIPRLSLYVLDFAIEHLAKRPVREAAARPRRGRR
jgi:hypothetical protein